jgi:hypothetical protein
MAHTQKQPSTPKKAADTRNLTSKVVRIYRYSLGKQGRPLSYLKFANALNEPVSQLGISVTYQAVKFWEDGIHSPDFFFSVQLANHAPRESWQRTFAMDVLSVQWPDLYQPGSEIGEKLCLEN